MTTAPPWLPWERRPLSIAVLGNSASIMQMPFRDHHGEGTYAEVLADAVAVAGVPVTLTVQGRWFEFAHRAARRFPYDVVPLVPDVVVVNYGAGEMMPWLAPVWLVHHLMRRQESLARTSRLYREHVAERLWAATKRWRKYAGGRLPFRTAQLSPWRFEKSMRLIVRSARRTTNPLILILDISPPSERLERYLPGIERNYVTFQRIVTDVATSSGPSVRLVEASQVCHELGVEAATPDGLHFTPEAHSRVGALLAEQVLAWLAAGGHR